MTISGDLSPSKSACTTYTVTRSEPAPEDLVVQPSLDAGEGGLYADSGCSELALVNISMPQGSRTAEFRYKADGFVGNVTLKVSLFKNSGADSRGTLRIITQ